MRAELADRQVLEQAFSGQADQPVSAEVAAAQLAAGQTQTLIISATQRRPHWSARLWRCQEQALPDAVAALITSVLSDDQARASGFGRYGVLEIPFAAAVKTSTSQQHRDN